MPQTLFPLSLSFYRLKVVHFPPEKPDIYTFFCFFFFSLSCASPEIPHTMTIADPWVERAGRQCEHPGIGGLFHTQFPECKLHSAIWIPPEKLCLSHLVRICSEVFKWATAEDWDVSGALLETSTGGKDSSWTKSPEVSWRFPGILQVHRPWCRALDGISSAALIIRLLRSCVPDPVGLTGSPQIAEPHHRHSHVLAAHSVMLGAAKQNPGGSSEGCRIQTKVTLARSGKLLNCNSLGGEQKVLRASSCSVSSSCLCCSHPDKEEGQLAGRDSRGFEPCGPAIVHLQDFRRTRRRSLTPVCGLSGETLEASLTLRSTSTRLLRTGLKSKTKKSWDLPPVKSLWLVRCSVFCQAPAREQTPQRGLLSSAKGILPSNFPSRSG